MNKSKVWFRRKHRTIAIIEELKDVQLARFIGGISPTSPSSGLTPTMAGQECFSLLVDEANCGECNKH